MTCIGINSSTFHHLGMLLNYNLGYRLCMYTHRDMLLLQLRIYHIELINLVTCLCIRTEGRNSQEIMQLVLKQHRPFTNWWIELFINTEAACEFSLKVEQSLMSFLY